MKKKITKYGQKLQNAFCFIKTCKMLSRIYQTRPNIIKQFTTRLFLKTNRTFYMTKTAIPFIHI